MNIRFAVILILVPMNLFGAVDHWETPVAPGSICRFLVPSSPVTDRWTGNAFDDSEWDAGPGGIGYGDEDDGTTVDTAKAVYCRYRFDLADPAVVSELILDMDFDDGFVAYLNGTELARYNLGPEGSPVSWDQLSDGFHEALLYQGNTPMRFTLDRNDLDLLVSGENILSVEVHNQSAYSSDLSSNLYLHAGISTSDHFFDDPPGWFNPPFLLESTKLPIMVINTGAQDIQDEVRITAQMGLIFNGEGNVQSPDDPFNEYEGAISIETRGESSSMYPKKSYSFETQTDSGTNNNVSLLGLPPENDFVLYAPYGDKSQIRNVVSYRLFEKMGHYSPRTRFIELVVNNDYKGIYVLVEKIKRDQNRVNIAKITPGDTAAPDVTGGYILRVDKTSKLDPSEYWLSDIQPPISGYGRVEYQYFDPGYDELTTNQRSYIRNYMQHFEQVLTSPEYKDPMTGYRSVLDIPSFVDLMILNEFTKDVDAFRLSHYFYKQRDDQGGKIVQGPPWDYNLTFGNNDFAGDINSPSEWIYTKTMTIYWWAWLLNDPWFQNQVYCRWEELYHSILDPETVSSMIDELLFDLEDAIQRNYQQWPVLGVYVWPNSFVGETFQEEEEFLRTWIDERLLWMESKWGGVCISVSAREEALILKPGLLKVYPNPSDLSNTYVSIPFSESASAYIRLTDLQGRVVFETELQLSFSEYAYRLPDLSMLAAGIYTLEVRDETTRLVSKIMKL